MTDAERLLEAVEKKSEPHLRAIRKRIEDGTATFADTAEYSRIVSELLGRELSAEVLGLTDREGTAEALLRESYNDTNEVCAQVQTALDEKKGLHLAPQKAPFPAERVAQFAHSLVDPTVPDDKIQRRAKSGTENISMSFHDDFIEQNAEFRERAGLKCYVTRTSSGSCCPWCTAVAGKYLMSEQPEGLFRRHDNCDCVIVYDGQVLRGQKGENGRRNKKWVEDKAARIEFAESVPKPAVNSPEQVKELEKRLTGGKNGGIISVEEMFRRSDSTHRKIGSNGQQIIDKPTYNKLVKPFIKRGGIIKNDSEAIEHLQNAHANAEYLPSFNVILITKEPTVSDILEETFHAEQDRTHRFGDVLTQEVYLRREIEAQEWLLSVTDKYKIPIEEVELTKHNLQEYLKDLDEYLKNKGGE